MSSPKHFLYKLISKALGSVEFTLNKDLKEKGHVSQLFPSGLHTNAHDLEPMKWEFAWVCMSREKADFSLRSLVDASSPTLRASAVSTSSQDKKASNP